MILLRTKFFALALLLVVTGCINSEYPIRPIYNKLEDDDTRLGNQLTRDHNSDAWNGWNDGCKSGYAVYGNHVYKLFYQYTRDANKVGNEQYEMNWYEAYNYCRQSINTLINQGVI